MITDARSHARRGTGLLQQLIHRVFFDQDKLWTPVGARSGRMGVYAADRLRREDPDYPASSAAEQQAVLPWLVRAHAAVLRARDHAATAAAAERFAALPGDAAGGASDAGSEQQQQQQQQQQHQHQQQPAVGLYDHYRVLDLPADFTSEQLRRAYKAASLRAHPDRRGANEPNRAYLFKFCMFVLSLAWQIHRVSKENSKKAPKEGMMTEPSASCWDNRRFSRSLSCCGGRVQDIV